MKLCMPSLSISISVIIPVRNCERYFAECLDSVINQTLRDIEIIVIDDASTDKSGAIADDYADRDMRIKVIHLPVHVGASSARNTGLDVAQGEYIAFIDSDDLYYSNNVLYKLYNEALKHKVDICGGSLIYINSDKSPQVRQLQYQRFNFSQMMHYREYQYDGGFYRFLYKKNFIDENNLRFIPGIQLEDCVFFVQAMHAAGYFYCINDNVYLYRKIKQNKESSFRFICKKLKARYIMINFAYKNRYLKLYCAQKNALLKDLKLFLKYFTNLLSKREIK